MSKYHKREYNQIATILRDAQEHFRLLEHVDHHYASSEDVISHIRNKFTDMFVEDNPHFHESTFFVASEGDV